ncbi:MAG: hypothetical protein IJY61_04885 [Candidatus Gastranaerophilales bacterium]|nr:hypothetical protein [Candidatus Gastranaerophilales bacterium]
MKNLAKYNNIEYFMPFLFCNDLFIPTLYKLFEDEVNPIKYVYGTPFCEWGIGARLSVFRLDNLNFVERYLQKLKTKYNVIPTFTFTNLNAKNKLNDEYSNNLLDIACSLECRIIISTKELYSHIKSRYPNAKIHSSVIIPSTKIVEEKNFDETKFYNKMLDKCEVVVIRPEYVMDNIDKLNNLISDISRVEILINQNCHYNCPHHRTHYNFVEEIEKCEKIETVKHHTNNNNEHFSLCPKDSNYYRSVYLTSAQVEKAIEQGVKKIKIQGRSLPFYWLFDELYKNFFNNEYSKEEIRNKIDKICAEIIQNDRKTALFINP